MTVGRAEDGAFAHFRVAKNDLLDGFRRDFLAGDVNDVGVASEEEEATVAQFGAISGAEAAVAQGFVRLRKIRLTGRIAGYDEAAFGVKV